MDDPRFPLGKPIRPEPYKRPDVAEKVAKGVYRFQGKLQTALPTAGPRFKPVVPVTPPFADTISGDDLANAAGLP